MEELNYTFSASYFYWSAYRLLYSYKEAPWDEKKIAVGSVIARSLGAWRAFEPFDFGLPLCRRVAVYTFMPPLSSVGELLVWRGLCCVVCRYSRDRPCVAFALNYWRYILAKEVIPLSGMITGNALNVYTQFADRLKGGGQKHRTLED